MVAAPDGSAHVSGQYSLAAVVRLFKIAHLPLGSSGPLTASSAGVSPADISDRLVCPPCQRYPRAHKTYVRYRTLGYNAQQ